MENFILKIIAIVCVSMVCIFIIVSRKDDLSISSVIISVILELLTVIIIFSPEILWAIKEIITLF